MISLLVLAAVLPVASANSADPPPETAAAIVAAAVRDRGFVCDRPISAEREPSVSQDAHPGEPFIHRGQPQAGAAADAARPVWIIRCDNARYRVVFEGDTGARVTPLE
jgi:hypothetical protein